ncbi:TRAP transporter substrate-binding protein DctP (plasmid) [Tistrella bauzanensis]|uniref:TRAP transporter substrate-binding protein DctP n=1 Tax=Tistrella TaxID=171436 RepID=UPI0031F60BA9
MSTTISRGLGLLLGATALTLSAGAAVAQTTMQMTTTWTSGINLIEGDKKFVEIANKLTGDDLKIQFFEGNTLVPSTQVFDAVQSNTVNASADWPGYWAGKDSAFGLLGSYPMLFTAADYILWTQQWGGFDAFQEAYGKFGMVYLPYAVVSMESGLRAKSPIPTLDDMNGKRIRMSGRAQGEILKRLGAAQTQIAGGEVYQALERGVVDAAEFSGPGVDFGMGLQEVTQYWMTPGWHQPGSMSGVMINKDFWDKLPKDVQEKLKIAADATMTWSLGYFEHDAVAAVRKFKESGTEVVQLPDADVARLQKISNQALVEEACANPLFARIAASQVTFMADYAEWRGMAGEFAMGRNLKTLPDVDKLKSCAG